mmetsp:Transcript_13235/g.15398  ORF Transcript_13235/g.15398 Transcript_13235/m.15398 type:complete len:106 (-) Transcript_13235:141-458(-)
MKVATVAVTLLAADTSVASFSVYNNPSRLHSFKTSLSPYSSQLFSSESAICDIPKNVVQTDLTSQKGSGSILRSAVLTNVNGDSISLGSKMGQGKSIVIFLRHMG